jgi:hypothetical protein
MDGVRGFLIVSGWTLTLIGGMLVLAEKDDPSG